MINMIHIICMCIGPIILVLSGKEDGLCDEGMDGGVAKNVVQKRYTAIPPRLRHCLQMRTAGVKSQRRKDLE